MRILLAAALALILPLVAARAGPADVVFTNGTIYTVNPEAPRATAVAVSGGRIVYVGDDAGALAKTGPETRRVDLAGLTMVPGLADAHAHITGIGLREMRFNLEGTKSLAHMLEQLAARAGEAAPGHWVTGRGWIETHWPEGRFPTRFDLDSVVAGQPVLLERSDGHAVVANSLALELAGIDEQTPNPPGGEFMRDGDGRLTGMVLDNGQAVFAGLVPPPAEDELREALVRASARSLALGWTQLHNAGGEWAEIERIRALQESGRFPLRVYFAVDGPGPDAERLIRQGPLVDPAQRLTVRGIKLYMDGALGSKGAALLEPYQDHPGRGLLLNTRAQLMPVLLAALKSGIQVQTHAIGDRANRLILDWYGQAFAAVSEDARAVAAPRWRIEHTQILHLDDIPRLARLGVIASMQPSHAIGDLHFAPDRLGMDRLAGAYAWRALLDEGTVIAAGSDAPVEQGDPRIEFYAAVARRDLNGYSGPGWHPEQAVSRAEALRMMTFGPAFAAFQEDLRGSIEAGKLADFTVFSSDIMTVPESEIPGLGVAMTVINGDIVYQADNG